MEGVARNFTSRVAGMDGLDYWEKLKCLGMYSQERRRERYQVIFIWKLSQGLPSPIPAECEERSVGLCPPNGYHICICSKEG